ncbi:cadherin-related family member 5-like [Gracilinanus agilis]|uniref:cadherin-related family member 5-like n=1 Tax=Gracilinanus agilis TaxID=191870 RepID=UPI001CFD949E|nr:cadherin-related family member 5-like [Gracilinanus agilis]
MAAVGGVLGALLLLSLILLGIFTYKHYGDRMKCGPGGASAGGDAGGSGYDNDAFKDHESPNWVALPSPSLKPGSPAVPPEEQPPAQPGPELQMPETQVPGPAGPEAMQAEKAESKGATSPGSQDRAMRSILTKERKANDSGYKAVWFGEDIGAQVDVVVINSPGAEEEAMGEPGPAEEEEEEPEAEQSQSVEQRAAGDNGKREAEDPEVEVEAL